MHTPPARTRNPWPPAPWSFIRAHATEGISLQQVAHHVARSPGHVASLVRAHTGDTIVGWITRVKMAHARRCLLHTDDNVEQIASAAGFASVSHFHRVFKRAHNMTPGSWRGLHVASGSSS